LGKKAREADDTMSTLKTKGAWVQKATFDADAEVWTFEPDTVDPDEWQVFVCNEESTAVCRVTLKLIDVDGHEFPVPGWNQKVIAVATGAAPGGATCEADVITLNTKKLEVTVNDDGAGGDVDAVVKVIARETSPCANPNNFGTAQVAT
jgi:hypothetical protein